MENENINRPNLTEKVTNILKRKKKSLILILLILITVFFVMIFLNYSQNKKNEKIAEQYIKAGIYLSSKDKENSQSEEKTGWWS